MRSKQKADFEGLVGRIQATSEALQQDALVVINRSVTTRAWLTGYYIVEYEQHGEDRAKYGAMRKARRCLTFLADPMCGFGADAIEAVTWYDSLTAA